MKKIAAITFHSAHNFGSCLQAYALQEYVKRLGKEKGQEIDYKIINLRKDIQDKMYNYVKNSSGVKKILKKILYGNSLERQYQIFEDFINNSLQLTPTTYHTLEDLKKADLKFDYYISGSDQIWNVTAQDFDWAYMLDFPSFGTKISYAASFGPKERKIEQEKSEKIKNLLNQYKYISVREEGTKSKMAQYTDKPIEINVDPTMLLSKQEWEKLIDTKPLYSKHKYLLFYTLRMSKERVSYIKKLAKKLGLHVVVITPFIKYDMMGGFVKLYDTGPKEFLNLIKNAELVISSSFHGTVFSIVLNKPFYSLDGLNDNRISTLLKETKLENRSLSIGDEIKLEDVYNVEFTVANAQIEIEKERSKKYLLKALDL